MVCVRCKTLKDGQLIQVIDNNGCKIGALTRIKRTHTSSRSRCRTILEVQLVNSDVCAKLSCHDINTKWKFIADDMVAKRGILPILVPHTHFGDNNDRDNTSPSEREPDNNIRPPLAKKRKLNPSTRTESDHENGNAKQPQTVANQPETPSSKAISDLSCADNNDTRNDGQDDGKDVGAIKATANDEAKAEPEKQSQNAHLEVDSAYDFEADIARRRQAAKHEPLLAPDKQLSPQQMTELSMFQRLHRFREQQRLDSFPDSVTIQIWFKLNEAQAEQLALRYFEYRRRLNETANDRKPFIVLQNGQLRCTKCSEKSVLQQNMETHVIREHGDNSGYSMSRYGSGSQAISDAQTESETENFHDFNRGPPVCLSHVSMHESEMRDKLPPLSPVLTPAIAPATPVSENALE